MACGLCGTRPLSEPMLPYCQLDSKEYFGEILFKIQTFSFKEMHLKMSSAKWRPFCHGLNVSIHDSLSLNINTNCSAVFSFQVGILWPECSGYFCVKDIFNTLRPRQNGLLFADGIFKCIFMYENIWISIKISLKFGPKGPINNIPALIQIMAWRQPGDKPLSEARMVSLLRHICVAGPQWVKCILWNKFWWFESGFQ